MMEFKIYGDAGGVGDLTANLYHGNFKYSGNQGNTISLRNSGSVFTISGRCTSNVNATGESDDAIMLTAGTSYVFAICCLSGEFNSSSDAIFGLWNLGTGTWYDSSKSAFSVRKTNYQNTRYVVFTPWADARVTVNVILPKGEYINLQYGITIMAGKEFAHYEPYGCKIPVVQSDENQIITHSIYIDKPLYEDDYIDFKQKKVFRKDGITEDVDCELPKINKKTTVFYTDSKLPASNMYGKYIGT